MDNIYWVITRDCNQHCGHCYNDSKPGAQGLTKDEATACVNNLPDPDEVPVDRIALSGGEVYVNPDLLFHLLLLIQAKYGNRTVLAVQTNGDLLTPELLDRTLSYGVTRFAVSSQDKYHVPFSTQNKPNLEKLFASRGFETFDFDGTPKVAPRETRLVSFWGATEDLWIGPLWPRGRAMKNGLAKCGPTDDFCGGHSSGAKNSLNYLEKTSSLAFQLADVYLCCPMTCRPVGDLRSEKLKPMLDRLKQHPAYRALNEGKPEKLGEYMGLSEAYGIQRTKELGNHCLWCDEFFTKHAPELLHHGGMTERGTVDLTITAKRQARKAAELAATSV